MSSLYGIDVLEKSILSAVIFMNVFLSIILVMNHYSEKRHFPYLPIDISCLTVTFLEYNLLVCAMSFRFDGKNITGWRIDAMQKPSLWYEAVQLVIAVILICLARNDYRWRKEHISIKSIKESIDSMPFGICCYYESGMPRLINREMHSLAKELFGEELTNGAQFWERVNGSEADNGERLLTENQAPAWMLKDSRVWSFTREKITYGTGYLYEILAADITEEYEKTQQLTEDNKRMRIITEKLKEYSQNVTRLTIEKEVLDAKIRVHSELGQTLVATRRYLVAGDIDSAELLSMWKKNIKLLKKESISIDRDDYAILQVNAEQLGIRLIMPGEFPMEEDIKEIVISAVNECITNAFKYAAGKTLQVTAREEADWWQVRIVNEEDRPEEIIKERGGLRNLRRKIESKGGAMELAVKPCFCLTITMKKGGKQNGTEKGFDL